MKPTTIALWGIFILSIAGSCTTARWTVKDKHALDTSDFEIISEKLFLKSSENVTPENPILILDLHAERTYRYSQRVQVQRTIQDYRPQLGSTLLGLTGAALSFYVANSPHLSYSSSSVQYYTLTTAGSIMALTGLLNMKPVGEPRLTGEEHLLRTSGDSVQVDTVSVIQSVQSTADVEIAYGDSIIFEEEGRGISAGHLSIPLADKLEPLQLAGPQPGNIAIDVTFQDSSYAYKIPVNVILEPYARITSPLTELRNTPTDSQDNILADLMTGSLIKVKESEDDEWFKVLYGISENYIRKEDAELIWRASGFARDNDILSVPRIPFGKVDVENNIPILRKKDPNSVAFIITNENYPGDLSRTYAHRDGMLMKTYLENALGYPSDNIISLQDIKTKEEVYNGLKKVSSLVTDSTRLFIYINGHGIIQKDSSDTGLSLRPVAERDKAFLDHIFLKPLLQRIAELNTLKTFVLSEIDFSRSEAIKNLTAIQLQDLLDEETAPLANKQQSALLMGMQLNQPSGLYVSTKGEDKKHHIFPYYFAKSLQRRRTKLSNIYQYLQRNIPYTSRKLYDSSQDPLLLGNTTLDLVNE